MGRPPAIAFSDEPPGNVDTTSVHGFVPGLGGWAQPTMGAPTRSPSHRTGAPPAVTTVCFGMSMTLPPWAHMMAALTFTSGGIFAPPSAVPEVLGVSAPPG